MRRRALMFLRLGVLALTASVTTAQAQSAPALNKAIADSWNEIHDKVLAMAKDFPQNKLDYRPTPESRSFAEEIWHITVTSQWLAAAYKDEKFDWDAMSTDSRRPKTREGLIQALESTVKENAARIEKEPIPKAIGVLEHAGEHYGKMVVMYRLNGLVPPFSRNP